MLEGLVLVRLSSRMYLWAVNTRTILLGLFKVAILANLAPQEASNKVVMPRQHYGRTDPPLLLPPLFMCIVKFDAVGVCLKSNNPTCLQMCPFEIGNLQ